jgi:hypothetical protein
MDETIVVEARYDATGEIVPQAFIWRDQRYQISDLGRQWVTEDERHFLVMTPNREVYELAYLITESKWRLRRTPDHFGSPGSTCG